MYRFHTFLLTAFLVGLLALTMSTPGPIHATTPLLGIRAALYRHWMPLTFPRTIHATTTHLPGTKAAGTALWEVTSGLGDDGATVNAFLPQTIHIVAGDTVRWHIEGAIEPHTITLGPPAAIQQLATHLLVPVPQRTGPPLLTFNPQAARPLGSAIYGGSGMVSSGMLVKGQTYSLTFPVPGTYHYYCLLHYPYMVGTVVVAPRPRLAQDVIQTGYPDLGKGASADQFYDANFAPTELTIHAGDTVTWRLTTAVPHTISFGPSALLAQLLTQQTVPVTGSDGLQHLAINPRIAAPAGGTTYSGNGVVSSGLLFPRPGQTLTYSVTFPTPGDYTYRCLLHRGMDGTIHVLPVGA